MTSPQTPGTATPPVVDVPGQMSPRGAGDRAAAARAEGSAAAAAPRVIGLDLSLTGTGIASNRGWVDTVTSTGKADATLGQRRERLARLAVEIATLVGEPHLVAVETPAYDSRGGHAHDRSGLWWLIVSGLMSHEIPVVEVTTGGRAKYATGKGNAGKDAVLAAVVRRYPNVEVTNNNEADALVLAAMGARHLGYPIDDLPQTHLAAMTAVAWPVTS